MYVQGYETLKNPMKKRLYDAYVSDVNVDVPEGMSYAEWEAQQVGMACSAWHGDHGYYTEQAACCAVLACPSGRAMLPWEADPAVCAWMAGLQTSLST